MNRAKRENEEDFDVDQEFLDRVLNKLYDFGDGPDDKRSKRTDEKRKQIKQDKSAKAQQEPGHEKDRVHVSHASDCSDRISALMSAGRESLERRTSNVEIVTFQDPRKRNKLKQALEPEPKIIEGKEKGKKKPDALSMEKARLDVHRFGITGFQKQQQRVFEQDRAIMLGARPPKKDYVNYKVYQQMIKEKKSKEKEDQAKSDGPKKTKKSSGKQKYEKDVKRKSGSFSAEPTGHVGRFKNGMLVLSSKDIQKLNSKVKKKRQ